MRMNEPMTLGRWMKRLRADLDMTQEALAEAVGCAVQTIRTFEIGRRRPSRELVEGLADVLQVPPEQRADFVRLARAPVGQASAGRSLVDADGSPSDDADAPSSASPGREQVATEGTA